MPDAYIHRDNGEITSHSTVSPHASDDEVEDVLQDAIEVLYRYKVQQWSRKYLCQGNKNNNKKECWAKQFEPSAQRK